MKSASGKLRVMALIGIFVTAGIAAMQSPDPPTNLQILPKDISLDSLNTIMENYSKALGVKCNFCHTVRKGYENYASDSIHAKQECREMMLMTIAINKTYFRSRRDSTKYREKVTCYTCHQGKVHPVKKPPVVPPADNLLLSPAAAPVKQ